MTISIPIKSFTIFHSLNKAKPKTLSKKRYWFQDFDFDEVDKFDLHMNKNAKYILYRYNSYLKLTHQNKQIIRHPKKVEDKVGLEKI